LNQPDSTVTVVAAEPRDVETIYILHRKALGDRLKYTIYQSDLSVCYFREIARHQEPTLALVVAKIGKKVVGYYLSVDTEQDMALNYIAVSDQHQGIGVGNRLLESFEQRAALLGRKKLMLDVFTDNPRTMEWYARHGYQDVSKRYFVRLYANRDGSAHACNLDSEGLAQALREESMRGFSRVRVQTQSGELMVGLIDGTTCRVLATGVLSLQESVAAAESAFPNRRWIVCTTEREDDFPSQAVDRIDCSVRMEKAKL
jgi:ribosomal protein S18 acetylase RimI-like enzyme